MSTNVKQKTQHTPGPWYIVNSLNPNHSFEIFGADGYHVARFEKDGIETELANARLIAAAPELLEACKEMVRHLEETDFDVCGTPDSLMNKWKAAIAKATGEKEVANA